MDAIDRARVVMERADDAFEAALARGASNAALDVLAQIVADTEAAYYRACEAYPAYAR